MTRTLITNICQLVTPADGDGPVRGEAMAEPSVIEGAAIAIEDGLIVKVGWESEVNQEFSKATTIDAQGALAIPGLVDCHAHPIFAGDRSDEFELRNLGADYEAIHAAGGGIQRTVQATRAALSAGALEERVRQHFDWQLAAGTTTSEAKSGYGLSIETELECLKTAASVARGHKIDVVQTILAAHSLPPEYDDTDRYIDEIAIPAVRHAAADGVAAAADVFLERGAFTVEQSRRYLSAAREVGLELRLHGDQFTESGAVDLAIELGARSIDHLEATRADGARKLGASDVAAVLLPLSSLFLRRPYAPGRELIDAGAIVALASDFNPGSSYGESLTLAMALACTGCGLRIAEALTACTINAAWVLGLHEQVGRLAPGYQADVVLLDQPNLANLGYHVGTPGIRSVIKAGRVV
jgi:imidazolonepropionase